MNTCVTILEGSPISKQPLLGKPCSHYVNATLKEANISLDNTKASNYLFIREDAPLIQSQTLIALLENSDEFPNCIYSIDDNLPLALAFSAEVLENYFPEKTILNLEEAINYLKQNGLMVMPFQDEFAHCYIAVQSTFQYAEVLNALQTITIEKHLLNGVLFISPQTVFISPETIIGKGTIVYGGNVLEGESVVGENCILYPNNRFKDASIGNNVTVENSVLLECSVGNKTTVGPFAYLRPHTKVGDNCRIGDFVEIKNSNIDNGTKVSHLTYVGDSDLGKNINLGCGVVFVNYDGKSKNRSTIQDNAFIGCNTNIISPVQVGEHAYIAAGSTITENVPDNALYVARAHGTIKEEWVTKRKKDGKL